MHEKLVATDSMSRGQSSRELMELPSPKEEEEEEEEDAECEEEEKEKQVAREEEVYSSEDEFGEEGMDSNLPSKPKKCVVHLDGCRYTIGEYMSTSIPNFIKRCIFLLSSTVSIASTGLTPHA